MKTSDDLLAANNREAVVKIEGLVTEMWRLKVLLNFLILDDGLTRVVAQGPLDEEARKFLEDMTGVNDLYRILQQQIDRGLIALSKLTGKEWTERVLSSHPE